MSPANPDADGHMSFSISASACSYQAAAAKLRQAFAHDLLLKMARERRAWRERNSKLAVFPLRHEYNITPQEVLEQSSIYKLHCIFKLPAALPCTGCSTLASCGAGGSGRGGGGDDSRSGVSTQ